jgi:hypothetical protein
MKPRETCSETDREIPIRQMVALFRHEVALAMNGQPDATKEQIYSFGRFPQYGTSTTSKSNTNDRNENLIYLDCREVTSLASIFFLIFRNQKALLVAEGIYLIFGLK